MFNKKLISLNNNQLKIIALISMVIDHAGLLLFPRAAIFRILGRLSFPIYAYMIAEGCAHTKNRKTHLGMILGLGLIFQIVWFLFSRSLYHNILLTFSLSIGMIYAIDGLIKNKNNRYRILMILAIIFIVFVGVVCPILFSYYGFDFDYSVWGIVLPILIYFAPTKATKLEYTTILLCAMACFSNTTQWFALFSIPLLSLYNGKKGRHNLKYLFYIVYPLHLIIIYGILILIHITR